MGLIPAIFPATESYLVNGVIFDGSADYLTRGAALTGVSDGSLGTIAFWFNYQGSGGARQRIIQNASGFVVIRMETNNKLEAFFYNSGGTLLWYWRTIPTFTSSINPGWHHVACSWSLTGSAVAHMYLDDVSGQIENQTGPNLGTVHTARNNWAIGATESGAEKFDGYLADIYINLGQYVDLSSEANRRKILDERGLPADTGSQGEKVTGTAAHGLFNGETDEWHTNKGTGGGFTENGAITTAPGTPIIYNVTDSTKGQTATASSASGGTPASDAISDKLSEPWTSGTADTQWWQVQFSAAKAITQLRISAGDISSNYTRHPRDFTLKASNTGAFGGEETTLLTVDESGAFWSANETKQWTFANSTAYTYYRINMTDKQDSFGRVAEYYLDNVEMREVPV